MEKNLYSPIEGGDSTRQHDMTDSDDKFGGPEEPEHVINHRVPELAIPVNLEEIWVWRILEKNTENFETFGQRFFELSVCGHFCVLFVRYMTYFFSDAFYIRIM